MSVAWRHGELAIEGSSRAGDHSWFRIHPPGLAFDTGRGAGELVGTRDLFVTHGHLDHALGVPFVLSQRTLQGAGETRIFCPAEIESDLAGLIAAAARLERVAYRHSLRGLRAGDRIEVGRELAVVAFAVDHGLPSLGYHLVRRRRHLAAGWVGATAAELVAARARGARVEEESEEVWLSYPGDTAATVFEQTPDLYASRVLLLECTFLDPAMRQRAARYQHVHLEDLVERRERFRNEAIVLCHLSRRHRASDLRRAVRERLGGLADRIHVLVEED